MYMYHTYVQVYEMWILCKFPEIYFLFVIFQSLSYLARKPENIDIIMGFEIFSILMDLIRGISWVGNYHKSVRYQYTIFNKEATQKCEWSIC